MIKQNDSRLNRHIRNYGCNLLAHLAMIRMDWTPDEIEAVYQKALKAGYVTQDCSVKFPQELLKMMGTKLQQIGSANLTHEGNIVRNSKGEPDEWGAKEKDARVKFIIVMWSQRDAKFNHFTLHSRMGEIYDPFDANPPLATYALSKQCAMRVMMYG